MKRRIHFLLLALLVALLVSSTAVPLPAEASNSGSTLAIVSVKSVKAYVYAEARYTSKKVSTLTKGEEYPIITSTKYYYKIQLLGGKQGWIKKSQVLYKKAERIVMGWNYGGNTDLYMKQSASPTLEIVSPRWFSLSTGDPMVAISVDPRYVQWAHDNGKKVWPLFGNRFDPVLTDSLLSSPDQRSKVVTALKNALIQHGIDGINIDFENMDIKNKADFVAFIRELRAALKPSGRIVSVSVTRTNPDPFWSGSYDRRQLGKAADYMMLMAYDEHWDGGPAGSVASLPWTEEGIKLLMNDVPSHKIVLGVPFYTREWVTDPSTGKVTSTDRSMPEVEKLIADKTLNKVWDTKAKQYYLEFVAENGEKHQIWIEDEKSMTLRRDLINKYRLIGVAAWHIGLEKPAIWNLFQAYR
jgi:uncharacterized protein YgiM (DUF1202 family)